MAESGTDQGAQENVQEETGQMFFRSLLVSIDLDHDHIAQCKTQREKQAVPAQGERTESENIGIYIPNQSSPKRLPDCKPSQEHEFVAAMLSVIRFSCFGRN